MTNLISVNGSMEERMCGFRTVRPVRENGVKKIKGIHIFGDALVPFAPWRMTPAERSVAIWAKRVVESAQEVYPNDIKGVAKPASRGVGCWLITLVVILPCCGVRCDWLVSAI